MTRADVSRVIQIAASLIDAPQWPESAYLTALDPASTRRRIALVAECTQTKETHGFTVASQLAPQAELETIAVAPGSQRRGIGRLLFQALAAELRAVDVHEIVLEVRASNRFALGFYRSLGFCRTGIRPSYYSDPVEDAVLMELSVRK